MKILNNVNLKNFNTFHLNSIAKNFFQIDESKDFFELESLFSEGNYFILGGGSNILLSKEIYENVISINTKGIEITYETEYFADVTVAAGEDWHHFLEYLLKNKLYGLENLALIPGKCGAAPIQNIGAYGVEQEQYFLKATVYDPNNNIFFEIDKEQCRFNYRYSIFKTKEFKKLIINDVSYRLNKEFSPNLNYNELKKLNRNDLTPEYLFNYISDIRKAKIPYPEEVGNAGSFFKNPFITKDILDELLKRYPDIPHYIFNNGYKLSAGWLIEKSGLKGKALNDNSDAQVSNRHSLILINKGNAKGEELVKLSELIIENVYKIFDIKLEREVNLI